MDGQSSHQLDDWLDGWKDDWSVDCSNGRLVHRSVLWRDSTTGKTVGRLVGQSDSKLDRWKDCLTIRTTIHPSMSEKEKQPASMAG